MLKRLVVVILIAFITLAALSELVLPGVLARGLERALETTFGPAGEYEVTLKSHPSARMLLGRFDEINVMSTNVQTSTLVLESMAVTFNDASVDLKALVAEGDLRIDRSRGGNVTITISEVNLAEYIAEYVPTFVEPRVLVTPETAALSGCVEVGEREVVFTLTGLFVLADEQTVSFDIQSFSVDGVTVPADFLATWLDLLNQPDLSFDLGQFPLPLKGTGVSHEDGRVVIEAEAVESG